MYAFLVLVALALALSVVLEALHELIGLRLPAALTSAVAVAVGVGVAWALGYSVFTAFGQDLRAEWMHPVMTGLVLVAVGEVARSVLAAVARRSEEAPVGIAPAGGRTRAA